MTFYVIPLDKPNVIAYTKSVIESVHRVMYCQTHESVTGGGDTGK